MKETGFFRQRLWFDYFLGAFSRQSGSYLIRFLFFVCSRKQDVYALQVVVRKHRVEPLDFCGVLRLQ